MTKQAFREALDSAELTHAGMVPEDLWSAGRSRRRRRRLAGGAAVAAMILGAGASVVHQTSLRDDDSVVASEQSPSAPDAGATELKLVPRAAIAPPVGSGPTASPASTGSLKFLATLPPSAEPAAADQRFMFAIQSAPNASVFGVTRDGLWRELAVPNSGNLLPTGLSSDGSNLALVDGDGIALVRWDGTETGRLESPAGRIDAFTRVGSGFLASGDGGSAYWAEPEVEPAKVTVLASEVVDASDTSILTDVSWVAALDVASGEARDRVDLRFASGGEVQSWWGGGVGRGSLVLQAGFTRQEQEQAIAVVDTDSGAVETVRFSYEGRSSGSVRVMGWIDDDTVGILDGDIPMVWSVGDGVAPERLGVTPGRACCA